MSHLARFLRENGATLAVVAVLAVAFFALRSSPSDLGTPEEFALSLQGRPTVAYFYSNT